MKKPTQLGRTGLQSLFGLEGFNSLFHLGLKPREAWHNIPDYENKEILHPLVDTPTEVCMQFTKTNSLKVKDFDLYEGV